MDQLTPATKNIYSTGQMYAGTFLGGPLAGIYMLQKNFQNLGSNTLAKKTVLFGVIFIFIAIFTSVRFSLGKLLPFVYMAVMAVAIQWLQGKYIQEHFKKGGGKCSYWRVCGIVFATQFVSITLALFIIFILIPPGAPWF